MPTSTGITGQYRVVTSEGIQTSVGNDELVKKVNPETTKMMYKRMAFYCDGNCEVIRNGKEKFTVLKEGGLTLDELNTPTTSFVIVTPGIPYYFMANY